MSQISVRALGAVTLAVLTVFAAAVGVSADEPRVVRIYDMGAGAGAMRTAAIRTAAAILEDAGIVVDWRDCSDRSAQRPCQNPQRTRDLIVRITSTFVAGPGALTSPAEAFKGPGDSNLPLGFAVIDPVTQVGELATIFFDRVQMVARRTGIDCGDLLGRALAHEVGHLLLGAAAHSRTGLMREVWTDAELMLNRREDWVFTVPERRRLEHGSVSAEDLDRALYTSADGRD